MPTLWATWLTCRLYFHFGVAFCLGLSSVRTNARAKHFTWKWPDFQENERTGDMHFHTNSFAQRLVLPVAKVNYPSMSWLREPLIETVVNKFVTELTSSQLSNLEPGFTISTIVVEPARSFIIEAENQQVHSCWTNRFTISSRTKELSYNWSCKYSHL